MRTEDLLQKSIWQTEVFVTVRTLIVRLGSMHCGSAVILHELDMGQSYPFPSAVSALFLSLKQGLGPTCLMLSRK